MSNAVTSEMYGVLFSWLWVSSLPHSLIVQLHWKLTVTVRDKVEHKTATLALMKPHIARPINI